jgi:CubicO group peptidase (beta-lactamase class C family)
MSSDALADFVEEKAVELGVPGVAVGVWFDGAETYACRGVTSIDNPLPVDADTLFALGSVTKTYTATALIRLVAERKIELDAPVRRYVPELALADDGFVDKISVLNLLNHSAGLDWRTDLDAGEGEDALARGVLALQKLRLIAPPGTRASYSQAGYNLAGRIVEKVTGLPFEAAVSELLLKPLDLSRSFFARDDIMTRRFAAGHNVFDGDLQVARPWKYSRGDNPGGGLASSAADQIRWCRFHLGNGCSPNGVPVVPPESLLRMRTPTIACPNDSLGEWIGLSWFLREVGGVKLAEHGGSANGQFANLLIAPERDFAIAALSNAGPDSGLAFNKEVLRWALVRYLNIVDEEPELLPFDPVGAGEIIGSYENDMMVLTFRVEGATFTVECQIRPEVRAAAGNAPPPDLPPATLSMLAGNAVAFIVTSGGLKGQRGCFSKDTSGAVTGVDLAGRLFMRTGM